MNPSSLHIDDLLYSTQVVIAIQYTTCAVICTYYYFRGPDLQGMHVAARHLFAYCAHNLVRSGYLGQAAETSTAKIETSS
jgi:hypothetical protein